MLGILSSFTTLDKRNQVLYSRPTVNKRERRLSDLQKKLDLNDRLFYLCLIVAGAYCVFAIVTMYVSLKLSGV